MQNKKNYLKSENMLILVHLHFPIFQVLFDVSCFFTSFEYIKGSLSKLTSIIYKKNISISLSFLLIL